jgi:hypothetical protein
VRKHARARKKKWTQTEEPSLKNNSSSLRAPKQRQIKLMSSDGQTFEVDEEVAIESLTVKNMIEGALFA